jgi:fructose-1,6-bisphosphatase I
VHAFTHEPSLGEFVLSNDNLQCPRDGKIYSVNEGNFREFSQDIKDYVEECRDKGYSARYIGSLVADFHRNMLKGGIYLYPATNASPSGKLRLLYECNALAFIAEQSGGAATDGIHRILEIEPTSFHQRTPFVIGSKNLVERVGELARMAQEV